MGGPIGIGVSIWQAQRYGGGSPAPTPTPTPTPTPPPALSWSPVEIPRAKQSMWFDADNPLNVRADAGPIPAVVSSFGDGVFAEGSLSAQPLMVPSSLLGANRPAFRATGNQLLNRGSGATGLGSFNNLHVASTGSITLSFASGGTAISGYPTSAPMLVALTFANGGPTIHRLNGAQIGSVALDAGTDGAFLFVCYGGAARLLDASSGPMIFLNRAAGDRAFTGDVGELIVCKAALTTDELARAEGYLAWKWGLQGSLAADHPYKNSAPISTYAQRDYFKVELSTVPWYANATYPVGIDDGVKTVTAHERFSGTAFSARQMVISQYHHARDIWQDASVPTVGLFADDHGVPALCKDYQGYWWIFGGAHNGAMQVASSKYPELPGTMVNRNAITGTYAYPHPFAVGSNIFLFMRRDDPTNSKMVWTLRKTTALAGGVATWGAEQVLVDLGNDTRFYQGNGLLRGDDLWMIATVSNYLDNYRRHIYMFIYNTVTGAIRNVAGTVSTPAGTTIDLATANASYRIVDQTNLYSNVPCQIVGADGLMHVAFMQSAFTTGQPGGNGGIPASDQPLFHCTIDANGVVSTPQQVAVTTHRYNESALTANSDGTVDLFYPVGGTTDEPRGGAIYRVRRATDGVWSAPVLTQAPTPTAMDRPTAVLGGRDSMKVLFCEIAQDSLDSAARLNKLFAYGSGGLIGRALP